jgi:uncharacterized membrane-anchored protein YjiN (DUF445 family)
VNKSFVTNLIAASITLVGYLNSSMLLLSIGLFALSGALTNWIAVYMLFEKIPGFYGSGVIPARFEEFKAGIRVLMMEQFFTAENIQRFLSADDSGAKTLDLEPVIDATDLSPAFDGLVSVIEESSFGSMLMMVGGSAALQPLKEPFTARLKKSLAEISSTDEFNQMLVQATTHAGNDPQIREKIASVIEKRLDELTPQLVKEIVQTMIKKHLGWLVVWGGVFGGLIGLIAGYINPLVV